MTISLLEAKDILKEDYSSERLHVIQKFGKSVVGTPKSYLLGSSIQTLCELSIKWQRVIIEVENSNSKFELEILDWLNHQLQNAGVEKKLSSSLWKKIRGFDSWKQLFLKIWALNPNSKAVDFIFSEVANDLKNEFHFIFQVAQICSKGLRPELAMVIKECTEICLITPKFRFQMLNFLSTKKQYGKEFRELAKTTIFSESKSITKFENLLKYVFDKKEWDLVKACAYRILSLKENHFPNVETCNVSSKLIYAFIKTNDIDSAIEAYQKYWMAPNIPKEFPFKEAFILAFHNVNPHHEIIQHLISSITDDQLAELVESRSNFALLVQAKQFEFEENWEAALNYYDALIKQNEQEEWKLIIACFIANNAMESDMPDLLPEFVYKTIDEAPEKFQYEYQKIKGILRVSVMDDLSNESALQYAQSIFENEDGFILGNLFPEKDFIFSSFFIPRILEALILSHERDRYKSALQQPLAIIKLPANDRLFLHNLIQIEDHLRNRRTTFEQEELGEFVDDFERTLRGRLDLRQLEILANKFLEADNYFVRDKFGDYAYLDVILLKEALIFEVAARLENIFDNRRSQLSIANQAKIEKDIEGMTIHTLVRNIQQFKNFEQ